MKTLAKLAAGSMLLVSALLAHADGAPHIVLYIVQTATTGG